MSLLHYLPTSFHNPPWGQILHLCTNVPVGKLRLRKFKELNQIHTADSSQGLFDYNAQLLTSNERAACPV